MFGSTADVGVAAARSGTHLILLIQKSSAHRDSCHRIKNYTRCGILLKLQSFPLETFFTPFADFFVKDEKQGVENSKERFLDET